MGSLRIATLCVRLSASPPAKQMLAHQIKQFSDLYHAAIEQWPRFSIEDVAHPESGPTAEKILDILDDMMDSSKILPFLHGSQKTFDRVIYELLRYTRCATGCETFEQFLYFYGKKGSNAKGTRIKLLLTALGEVIKGGYVGIMSASFFQQPKMLSPNKPDEATASMEDA